MNEINPNNTSATPTKHRYKLISIVALSSIAIILLVIYLFSSKQDPQNTQQNKNQLDIQQYAVLATTNAILKNYLVNEGEIISKSSAIAILIDPAFEARIQKSLKNVSDARLALEEKRIESITNAREIGLAEKRSILYSKNQSKNNKHKLLRQKELIHQLSVALATFQAKLVNLNSQPFGAEANQEAVKSTKDDITKVQGKLDIANDELKQLQDITQPSDYSITAHDQNKTTVISRSIRIAENKLKYEESLLEEIRKQEPQFSTIVPSPFKGLIIERLFHEGTYIRQGQPILILMKQE